MYIALYLLAEAFQLQSLLLPIYSIPHQTNIAAPSESPESYSHYFPHFPCCHIFTDFTIIECVSASSPQLGSHVEFATQKSRIAVVELSTHGLPPFPSLGNC